MNDFTPSFSPLVCENIDGRRFRLQADFTFRIAPDHSITVPKDFECDGQSYPRLLWMIDTPQGQGARAGFIHDYLYWLNGRPCPLAGRCYTRKEADEIYLKALKASGLNGFRSSVRHRMLRLFGKAAWNSHAKRIKAENLS